MSAGVFRVAIKQQLTVKEKKNTVEGQTTLANNLQNVLPLEQHSM